MPTISRYRWLLPLALLIILVVGTVGESAPAAIAQWIHFAQPVADEPPTEAQIEPFLAPVIATAGRRFWDTPPRSGVTAVFGDRQVTWSGPDDQVKVIVQLADQPVAAYRSRLKTDSARLTEVEHNQVNAYAEELQTRQQQALDSLKQQGIEVKVRRQYSYLFNGLAVSTKLGNAERIEKLPQVKGVYPDYERWATLDESVPLIGAPQVWEMRDASGQAVTGRGIRVAIIDTGIDYTHSDLGGGFGPGYKVVGGYDFVNDDFDPVDDDGHGTHVAGIVAANGRLKGVAPDAQLLAYKVLNAQGGGYISDIIAAIERATNPDGNPTTDDAVDVINLSLGGPGDPDDPDSQAVDAAVDLGVVVVVAAGNDGPGYQSVGAPGVARKALTVGASDKSDHLASFSSRGPVGQSWAIKPDVVAPGVMITSTVPAKGELGDPSRYRSLRGTSMATPHVAGSAALLKQLHPSWTPLEIKTALMNTAKDLGLGVYDQGAGRIQVAQAATTPFLVSPGSLSFGLPLLTGDNPVTSTLTVTNVSAQVITATASITTVLWSEGNLGHPLENPVLHPYARLSASSLTLGPGFSTTMIVTLTIPDEAPGGYYEGRVSLRTEDGTTTVTVPFAFALLSQVTIHVLDEYGEEWINPKDHWDLHNNVVYLRRVPEVDVVVDNLMGEGRVPATIYLPPGTYNAYVVGRFRDLYEHVRSPGLAPRWPFVLARSISVPHNAVKDFYLSVVDTHAYTFDATTFGGLPMVVGSWYASYRYRHQGKEYSAGIGFEGDGQKLPLSQLPTELTFLLSDTLPNDSFVMAVVGYGYSPRYYRFQELNAPRLYLGGPPPGYHGRYDADEAYLFAWQYPRLDEDASKIFRYGADEVSQYQVKYESLGPLSDPWLWNGTRMSGSDAVFPPPPFSGAGLFPFTAGLQRTFYVRGPFAYEYFPDHFDNYRIFRKEFYAPDWTRTYTVTTDPDVVVPDRESVSPLPVETKHLVLGAGPIWPRVTFDNTASAIRVRHPILAGAGGEMAYLTNDPVLAVRRDGQTVYSRKLEESLRLPFPMRVVSVDALGVYEVVITQTSESATSWDNTIRAGFTLPASDMNPPVVTDFHMPQRFAPGQPITATLAVTDAESRVHSVEMQYSTEDGDRWVSLAVEATGDCYMAQIDTTGAITISLAFTVTDDVGNYLAYTTIGAALRETPVTLTVRLTPTHVPFISTPVTVNISGTLRDENGVPLSEAAFPIPFYVNGQFVGYVRDLIRHEDGTFETGTINFDWAFVPTEFASEPGSVPVKFVFDLGTYSRQEVTLRLDFYEAQRVYLPLLLREGEKP